VIGIIIAFGVVAGIAVYMYMKRQNNRMKDDIDNLLRQYLPLEGGAASSTANANANANANGNGNGNGNGSNGTGGKKVKVKNPGTDGHRLIGQEAVDSLQDEESTEL